MIYNVEVNDRIIRLVSIKNEDGENVSAVGGNKGDEVRFTIYGDLNRTDVAIKAAFLWNGKYHLEDVIEIDAMQGLFYCYVPPIFNSNDFYLGLYIGEDADEGSYLSTNRVEIPCKLSIRDYIKVPQDSHLGKYTDIVAFNAERADIAAARAESFASESAILVDEARRCAESAREDAERAVSAESGVASFDARLSALERTSWKEIDFTNTYVGGGPITGGGFLVDELDEGVYQLVLFVNGKMYNLQTFTISNTSEWYILIQPTFYEEVVGRDVFLVYKYIDSAVIKVCSHDYGEYGIIDYNTLEHTAKLHFRKVL